MDIKKKSKVWCRLCTSFEEADTADLEYYFSMDPSERMSILQELRESYSKFIVGSGNDESRKGLRGHIEVFQQQ